MYLKSKKSRSVLLESFEIRNITTQVHDSNSHSIGTTSPRGFVLKVTTCGLPLSVDDSAVLEMLHCFDVSIKSNLKYENIQKPVAWPVCNIFIS